jgi:sirohydrochlorin cobaltochelatase
MTQPHAIILFAHGSRDPLWRAPLESVAQTIKAQHPGLPVACAYLELCTPDLPTVTTQLIAAYANIRWATGINYLFTIRIVPMFLGMGKHAREDLPELVAALRLEHPRVRFEIAQAVGEDARVTTLLAQIAVG